MSVSTIARDAWIERARATPIESECARRNIKLKRISALEQAGPCPICGGADRFAINTRKRVWHCRGCAKGGDIITMVMWLDGCGFADAVELLTGENNAVSNRSAEPPDPARLAKEKAETEETDRRHRAERLGLALFLWRRRQPVVGTIAETYLRRRGYDGPIPSTLGFLRANGEHPPSMIAAFGIPDEPEPGVVEISDDKVTGVHLTRLLPDGSDRERGDDAKMMVGLSMGSPIVLAPPNDLLGLAVVEGVETGLSVHACTGLGVWAAASASRMSALTDKVPDYIEVVTVYGEADNAGQQHAMKLAQALTNRGIEVRMAEALP